MAYQHKPGQGSLFPNDRKQSDNHPDYTGKILAHRDIKAGEELRLAAWSKQGGKGYFYSLSLSDLQPKDNSKRESAPVSAAEPLDDEIPF